MIKRGEKKLWNKWKHNSKRREEKGQKLEKRKKNKLKMIGGNMMQMEEMLKKQLEIKIKRNYIDMNR